MKHYNFLLPLERKIVGLRFLFVCETVGFKSLTLIDEVETGFLENFIGEV